jgi:hypothetical protein
LPDPRSHEGRAELGIGGEPFPVARLDVFENGLAADLHRQLQVQIGIDDGREQIIKRREGDCTAPITPTVEQAEILGMGIGIANDQIEDCGVEKFQNFARGARCCAAQQRETV